jgi:hypothetical protein
LPHVHAREPPPFPSATAIDQSRKELIMADLLGNGMVKVSWVPAIANIHAPTVLELTAGSVVDLQCVITADGLNITGETAAVDNTALCSENDTQDAGSVAYNLEVTAKRKDTPAEDVGWQTLTYKNAGNLVVRRDKPHADPYVASDDVEVYQVRCGMPVMNPPERNTPQTFVVQLFNYGDADTRAVVA